MLFRISFCFIFFLFGWFNLARAQQPCADISITLNSGTLTQPCDSGTIVNIDIDAQINFNFPVNETNTYTVSQIPYTPFPFVGANTVINGNDDTWSDTVHFPFPFCFFGNTYTKYIIGSNGRISFNTNLALQFDPWANASMVNPDPANNFESNNTIMSAYYDMDPGLGGTITWDTFGVEPCRTMVINWTGVPNFSCTGQIDTVQLVLYELTNIIDVNITRKSACPAWNSGACFVGIENANGTNAFMVPGKNGGSWSSLQESYRFEPAGNPYNFQTFYVWKNPANNVLSTTTNVTMVSPYPPFITCQATIVGGCTNDTSIAIDTVFFMPGKVDADFDYEVHLGCDNDTVIFQNLTVPINSSYLWNFGDLNFSTTVDTTHVYYNQGIYNVILIANNPLCISDTVIKTIDLNHPIDAAFAVTNLNTPPDDSVCLGDYFVITDASVPVGYLTYSWDFGDGNTSTALPPLLPYTYAQGGAYAIRQFVTDTLGCVDSFEVDVYVEPSPYVALQATPLETCIGETVNFVDSVAPHTVSWYYDFDDGIVKRDIHNPVHSFDQPGVYTVKLTGEYFICPDEEKTVDIRVRDYIAVDLGPDTMICPDITAPITLSNLANPAAIMEWSTGDKTSTLQVSDPGYYWAVTKNGNCTSSDSVWVRRDCYINIPNSFSPDGDGLNDYFLPRQLLSSGLIDFKMSIYNRWGELIFKTEKIDGRGWDGKYGDKSQPVGTYVYLIEAQFRNGIKKKYQGNVTLLR